MTDKKIDAGERALRSVQRLNDPKQLRAIKRACDKRMRVLSARAYKVSMENAWARAKAWVKGTEVWCCSDGVFLGSDIQRGWHATVGHVQPRAKRVWVICDKGKRWWFEPKGLVRYSIRTEKPAPDPNQAALASVGSKLGKMIAGDSR